MYQNIVHHRFVWRLVCLLVIAICLFAAPAAVEASGIDDPVLAANAPGPLFADLLQTVAGNRSRLIQVSFICIAIGIFILWKK